MNFSLTSAQVRQCRNCGISIKTPTISLKYMQGDIYKYTVIISKTKGTSVQRNRVKRVIREFMRLNHRNHPGGFYLIFLNKKCDSLDRKLLLIDLQKIIAKISHSYYREKHVGNK